MGGKDDLCFFSGGPPVDDEGIVVTESGPGAGGDVGKFDEFPIGHVGVVHAKEVTDGGGDIEPRALVEIGLRAFVAENVSGMVGAKGAGVFPLGIADAVSAADSDPSALADGMVGGAGILMEPGDDPLGLGLAALGGHIVVGKGDVEGILARDEITRDERAEAVGAFVSVGAAVVLHPFGIPATLAIGHGIVFGGFLADPKGGGDDGSAPWILRDATGRSRIGAWRGAGRPGVLLERELRGPGLLGSDGVGSLGDRVRGGEAGG